MERFPNFDLLPYQPMDIEEVFVLLLALQKEVPALVQTLRKTSYHENLFRRDLSFANEKEDLSYYIQYHLALSTQEPKQVPVNDLIQSEKFLQQMGRVREILPDTDDNDRTVLFILTKLAQEVSHFWNMVDVEKLRVRILDDRLFKITFPLFADQDRVAARKNLRDYLLLDIGSADMEFDLSIFYRAVFRALRKIGYEFEFRCPECAEVLELMRECKTLLTQLKAGNNCQSTYDIYHGKLRRILNDLKIDDIDHLDEDAFCDALSEVWPKTILAPYFDVYGQYPQKFPLKAKDY